MWLCNSNYCFGILISIVIFAINVSDDINPDGTKNTDSFGKGLAMGVAVNKANELGYNPLLGAHLAGKVYDVATGAKTVEEIKPGPVMSGILTSEVLKQINK